MLTWLDEKCPQKKKRKRRESDVVPALDIM
jgi:hypothetical protein